MARLRQQLDAAQQEAAGRAAAAAAAEGANVGLMRQLTELRDQLKAAVQQVRLVLLARLVVLLGFQTLCVCFSR